MRARGASRLVTAAVAILAAVGIGNEVAGSGEDREGYLGVVIGAEAQEITSRVGGWLIAVDVRIGDRVRKGDPLARLDDRSLRRALAIAETDLEAATAALRKAEAQRIAAQEAHQRREGAPELFSQEEILVAREQANAAIAEAQGASAAVREAELHLEQARQDLTATRLVSPVAGVVAARLKEPGMFVDAGAAVARILADGGRWVRFAVPPAEVSGLAPGTAVAILTAGTAGSARATVLNVAPEPDEASGMVFAEARLEAGGAVPTSGVVRVVPVAP